MTGVQTCALPIYLTIKAAYPTGKSLNTMMFLLSKRHPVNDPNFTADDIIINQLLTLSPEFTGPGWGGDYATWYDQDLDKSYNQDFINIRPGGVPGGLKNQFPPVTSMFVLCENWQLAGPPATDEMRVEIFVEDRGR